MRKVIVILIAVVIVTLTVSLVAQATSSPTDPEDGETGVAVGTNVMATVAPFYTSPGDCITLQDPGGQNVDGNPSGCGEGSQTATFDPDNDLAPNTTYTACIWYEQPALMSLGDYEPSYQAPQAPHYCWTFTTASPVGGMTYPNDTVHLLTPWVALAAFAGLALAGGAVALRKHAG